MTSNAARFTIRIDPALLKKLRWVAGYNARSANREIELLIRRHIEAFERAHGEINPDE